jgi:hypothetical protein
MPYTPEKRIIRHGLADVRFNSPDMDYQGWKEINQRFIDERERQYKETNDLYDLQSEQANELSAALEGTTGKDYEYLQKSIVESRNRLKELYKGKKIKDTRSPEFQTQLYNLRQDLANKRNAIDSFHGQVKTANDIAMNTPSIKRKEWQDFLNTQMQLPPDARNRNLVSEINTNPLFFNPYDYAAGVMKSEDEKEAFYDRETADLIINYQANYKPSLGRIKEGAAGGEFVIDPSNTFIDKLLRGDRRFYNAMAGMLPPDQANALIGAGNTSTTFPQAIRDVTKNYMKAVSGFEPTRKQLTSKMKPTIRPTVSDKKLLKEQEELQIIQNRLLENDERAFNDFISKDVWRSFAFEYDTDGNVNKIVGRYLTKDPRGRKTIEVPEEIDIDPKDPESVKQAINRIKSFDSKYKKDITVVPSSKTKSGGNPKKGILDDIE